MPFIVFEGIDGVGKTTQAELLEGYLRGKGVPVLRVRDPGGTPLGERVRDVLLDSSLSMDGWIETLLYFASRRALCEGVIKGALRDGYYVIAERFTLSTFAYQGYLRGVDLSFIEELDRKLIDLSEGPLYLLLDLSEELSLSRKRRNDRIELEPIEFFKRLRSAYLDLARKRKDVKVLDASGSPEEVFNRVLSVLRGERIL